jgi:hypothetical protein
MRKIENENYMDPQMEQFEKKQKKNKILKYKKKSKKWKERYQSLKSALKNEEINDENPQPEPILFYDGFGNPLN